MRLFVKTFLRNIITFFFYQKKIRSDFYHDKQTQLCNKFYVNEVMSLDQVNDVGYGL